MAPDKLFEAVVAKVEQNPEWNPTVLESTVSNEICIICHEYNIYCS